MAVYNKQALNITRNSKVDCKLTSKTLAQFYHNSIDKKTRIRTQITPETKGDMLCEKFAELFAELREQSIKLIIICVPHHVIRNVTGYVNGNVNWNDGQFSQVVFQR